MTEEEYDQHVQDCIKSEIKTFYPEEFEQIYGENSRYFHSKTAEENNLCQDNSTK